jgi:hypothetical protein
MAKFAYEIPLEKDRHGHYRLFEILPGLLSYFMLTVPLVLSLINVTLASVFIFVYLLVNFVRGVAGAIRSLHAYQVMRHSQKLPWPQLVRELEAGQVNGNAKRPSWHLGAIRRSHERPLLMPPSEVIHAVIIATYNESKEILQPTIEAVLASDFDTKHRVIFVLAYEGRAGADVEKRANQLVAKYSSKFMHAMAVKHPFGVPGETIGKGANVTHAGRVLLEYVRKQNIDPLCVMVTVLDADNRPDKNYLNALSYMYVAAPDPVHTSYQPVATFTNNIWDAPAPMRVLATGNTLSHLMYSLRLHSLRNFSSHGQPLAALIETDFWSVRTIVEDGHQFWRSYFVFGGKYRVLPVHLPIGQDAVLAESYRKTLKAQFAQLRRWTYGASDIAYFAEYGFFRKNDIPLSDRIAKFWRLLEGHVTWAVGPLLVLFSGFVPALLHPKSFAANELPLIVSHVQTVGIVVLVVTVFMALRTLPPKPARYKHHRTIFMVLQWAYFPITTLLFNCLAAFNSQTRLMFKKYLTKFDVTEKAVVTGTGRGKTFKV